MTETAEAAAEAASRRPDGEGGAPVPPPRLHLPLGRDLRRLPLHLRLRPARASTCCATSRTPGGAPWCSCATTWSGLDAAILGPPAVWEASGHLATFTDPLVDCKNCHERWRADKIDGVCPNCGSHDLTEARAFNLMFKTHAGPVEDEGHVAYLRPETAQGMFTNFANVLEHHAQEAALRHRPGRQVVPQRDHAAELRLPHPRVRADGDGVLRPARRGAEVVRLLARRAHAAGTSTSASRAEKLRLRHHDHERAVALLARARPTWSSSSPGAGTSSRASPTGATTTSRPTRPGSGETLDYFDPQTNERYTPYVIEPAAGATRTMMAFLLAAYDEDEVGGEARTVLRLHWRLAPYQVAVLPAVEEGHARAVGPPGARDCSSRTSCATTTSPRASAGATGARTRSARRGA